MELDVTYGEDIPWYGFKKLLPPTMPEIKNRWQSMCITFRHSVKHMSLYIMAANTAPKQSVRSPRTPPLHFSKDGKFHILQVANLHFSVSRGECLNTILSPCEALGQPHIYPPCEGPQC